MIGAWILSVVGVICLGIMLEIVLPDGKTTKYIKGTFSLLVVLVIASPLPSLINKEFDLDFDAYVFSDDYDFVSQVEQSKEEEYASRVNDALAQCGINAKSVVTMSNTTIVCVTVYVYDTKYDGAQIVAIVSQKLSVSQKIVRVYYVT